ncbi:hypothetical protein CASFOL_033669 [Castilleja foliolosa]|uniref:Uncharacterized protein n=1 Tax=Castilleja foliolosa TaxID=1961234 RepID=A0ABD3BXL9_9LAMI
MVENSEKRLSFSSLNPQLILHRHSSATISDQYLSGISTPPLQTPASVPFKWEQVPGKPRPLTRFGPQPEPTKSLDPPPFKTMQQLIMNMEYSAPKITQSPSPHSILDGPYNLGRPMFSSSRFSRDHQGPDPFESYSGPFEGTPYLLGGKKGRRKGLLGKFKGGKREVEGGISGFSFSSNSSCDSDESCPRGMEQIVEGGGGGRKMRRHDSFQHLSAHQNIKSSHIWASIYGGLKQAVHWKSSKR